MIPMFIARSFEVIDGKESFNDKEIFISLTWCDGIKASDIKLLDLFWNNILYTDHTIDFLPLSLEIPNIGLSKSSLRSLWYETLYPRDGLIAFQLTC